jgi:type 2 lantibiotic biosynthesis protein LanM
LDDLLGGFREAYELIAAAPSRSMLARRLAELAGVRRRVLARPTRVYALIQQAARSAPSVTDWFERAMWLEHLARSHVVAVDSELAGRILRAELAAMERNDVPIFEQVLGSADVMLDNGDVIHGAMEQDGLALALDRLDSLGPADLRRQTTLLAASVGTSGYRMTDSVHAHGRTRRPVPLTSVGVLRDAIVDSATTEQDGSMTWLTANAVGDATRVQLGTTSPGLYDGRAGIACFLLAQGDHDCAEATLAPLIRICDAADTESALRRLRHLGPGLLGIGGLLRFVAVGRRLAPDLVDWARLRNRLVASLDLELLRRETGMNILNGLAGLVRPLMAIVREHDDASSDELGLLQVIADRLVDTRDPASGAWPSSIAMAPLTGLSHGTSGMASALVDAFTATNDQRHLQAALEALDYEASRYDPVQRGWLDLRIAAARNGTPGVMHSWCHGSVGIALVRMNLLLCLPNHALAPRWEREAATAIEATLAAPPLPVDNLCCGNLGRIAGTLWLARALDRPDWRRRALTLRTDVLRESAFPRLGLPALSGVSAPGLMTGLAGVGMFLSDGEEVTWVENLML